MEMDQPKVCYSQGTINSLVVKLKAMKTRHPMIDPLPQELDSLRGDLVNKVAGSWHKQVRVWLKQIRELVYDIEDWMIDLNAATDFDESEAEERMKGFQAQINEARNRWKRYDLASKAAISDVDIPDAAPSKVEFAPQLLWEQKAVLVGIDGPIIKELEEHLEEKQTKRKVISVLGMPGVGKTTLVKMVYEMLNGQFECHASVTVGRNACSPVLMDIFLQVKSGMDGQHNRATLNEQEVILQLFEFLQNKRYFIILDDVRNTHTWSTINCALPYNDLGSQILTTTRVKDVAKTCSVCPTDAVYEMKGLDEDGSKNLLLSTMSAKSENRSVYFEKICDDMLNKCCGLPLAIIAAAGLFSVRLDDLTLLGKPDESGGMRNVLEICFADLAPTVKACFLYLGTFPENSTIKKDRLIRRWVTEGFILGKRDQESMLETGESYFNELICRKLIQPVFDDYSDDQAAFCTVHPVIHDFISSLSRQEDFHTTAAELISGPFPSGPIRRFSVNCNSKEDNEADTLISSAVHLSRMRSLTIFGDAGRVPDLSTFKHLRVLDFEDTKTFDDKQLETVGSLFLLMYLGLGGTNVTNLPQQIMELQHLSTLDVRRTRVMELPAIRSTELVSVLADGLIIPRGIGEMKQLEELSKVSLEPDDAVELFDKSRQLRILGLTFGDIYISTRANQQGMKRFLEEAEKSNLHFLLLHDYPSDSVKLFKCWANGGPNNLRKFELRISDCLQVVPPKMDFLEALTHLHIRVRQVEAQGVNALGSLPNLVLLKLLSGEGIREGLTISSQHGFRCLKVFWFSSYFLGMGLQFEAGAMPQLQRLQMEFHARKTIFAEHSFDFGIQHLSHLRQVRAIILCKHANDLEVKAADAAIRNQVSQIPCTPLPVLGDDLRRNEATGKADSSSSVEITISILPESSSPLPIPGHLSFAMEDAMVSSFTGAMNSVLTKLATLTGEQYTELTGSNDEQELTLLREELLVMNALLKQLSHTPGLNKELVECRNQMRELTYDIDDSIDDLMLHSVHKEGSGVSNVKRVWPHDFIDRIQKLNAQVEKADLPSVVRKSEMRTFGPRHMPREQWLSDIYYDERLNQAESDQPSEEYMRKIYADLSPDMKTCLLYFSHFPANRVVEKDRLIRTWAAEGFLPKRSLETWWETGESYFFELITRKLIEPVDAEEDYALLPTGCRINHYVHDFITSLSSEEDIVKSGLQGVFWKLDFSVNSGSMVSEQQKCSKVRSLRIEGQWSLPCLSVFIHVQVLDLEDFRYLREYDLLSIGRLSLLRYLGFAGNGLESLPQDIIELKHLETVDLRRNRGFKELPAFKSRKLVSLIADEVKLPTGIGETQALEELSTIRVGVGDDADRLAKVINQSKRLRRLAFNIHGIVALQRRNVLTDLLGAIGNSDIQSLSIRGCSIYGSVLDRLIDCWAQQRPRHLQKLELRIEERQPRVPRNMSPSLIELTHLRIRVKSLDTEGLCILGNLPNLVFLILECECMTERIIISENRFRCLRVFLCDSYWGTGGMGLQFKEGAMPQLRRLRLEFKAKQTESEFGGVNFGIQFLTCLVQFDATVGCTHSTAKSVMDVEAAMRDQVRQNPNKPVLEIKRKGKHRMVPDTVTKKGKTSYRGDRPRK